MCVCLLPPRPVRQDLADARGQEGRKEEDGDEGTQPQPGVQRVVRLRRALRARAPDEPRPLGDGLRPARPQRADRSGRARQQERPDGGEALERDVREEPAAGRAVAPVEGLPLGARACVVSSSMVVRDAARCRGSGREASCGLPVV